MKKSDIKAISEAQEKFHQLTLLHENLKKIKERAKNETLEDITEPWDSDLEDDDDLQYWAKLALTSVEFKKLAKVIVDLSEAYINRTEFAEKIDEFIKLTYTRLNEANRDLRTKQFNLIREFTNYLIECGNQKIGDEDSERIIDIFIANMLNDDDAYECELYSVFEKFLSTAK